MSQLKTLFNVLLFVRPFVSFEEKVAEKKRKVSIAGTEDAYGNDTRETIGLDYKPRNRIQKDYDRHGTFFVRE